MKNGYLINEHTGFIPANYDMVYMIGMVGKTVDPQFNEHWKNTNTLKRGIVHRPVLAIDADEYANASVFLELLEGLGRSNWDNGNPLMLDIWQAPADKRFNLDHVRVYGSYVMDIFKPKVKPLLRLNVVTWNAYLNSNKTEALRLLNNWDILLLQPYIIQPDTLAEIGKPSWWEKDFGVYAYDQTKQWEVSQPPAPVDPSPIEDPIEDDPIEEQPAPQPTTKKKYKVSLLGGLIKGTVEEIE
ncbi:MAG: hypothetical protein US46_C0014G0003 [Candidatus Shapirobacteria bacterium GW2011_GWF2_37_20]|nr:MAG: hypothetical protein US46_C0014G0003 [Candidatus Shapirobacteria bacterium GW2011_GWF2_37_20]